jgi:hypothetical protein
MGPIGSLDSNPAWRDGCLEIDHIRISVLNSTAHGLFNSTAMDICTEPIVAVWFDQLVYAIFTEYSA